MPELPEVEIMARNLRRWCVDRTIAQVDLVDDTIIRSGPNLVPSLNGATVVAVERRAKYAIVRTAQVAIIMHFRMTGKVLLDPPDERVRLRLLLDNNSSVGFKDTRRLGDVHLIPVEQVGEFFDAKNMGPDVYPAIELEQWLDAFKGAKQAIKPALLNQKRVAGVGNIIASEACFRARIDPQTPCPQLSTQQWTTLVKAVVTVIEHIIANEMGDEIQYVNDGGNPTDAGFSVYGRQDEPCVNCATPIARLVQSGRSTFYCTTCQHAH